MGSEWSLGLTREGREEIMGAKMPGRGFKEEGGE